MGLNDFLKIGDIIKSRRKAQGYTQATFAEKIGIPRATYANYENNLREPSAEILQNIAYGLESNMRELLADAATVADARLDFQDVKNGYDQELTNAIEVLEEAGFSALADERDIMYDQYYISNANGDLVSIMSRNGIVNLVKQIVDDSIDYKERYIQDRLKIAFYQKLSKDSE